MTDGEDTYYKVYCKAAREYMEKYGKDNLPDYFVGSADIPYLNRIKAQAIMQHHVDTAISSTINLPNSATKEDVATIYLEAWKQGLKGVTIFRDGCKKVGILTTDTPTEEPKEEPPTPTPTSIPRGTIIECSNDLIGKKRKLQTGCGSLHVLAYFDPTNGELQEVYLSKGSSGGCQNFMVGLSRTISLLCRAGVDLEEIIDQLNSTGVCPSYATRKATHGDTSKGSCCPMAIGNALRDMAKEMVDEIGDEDDENDGLIVEYINNTTTTVTTPTCPECGDPLVFEGGCNICKSCGWSKCN